MFTATVQDVKPVPANALALSKFSNQLDSHGWSFELSELNDPTAVAEAAYYETILWATARLLGAPGIALYDAAKAYARQVQANYEKEQAAKA